MAAAAAAVEPSHKGVRVLFIHGGGSKDNIDRHSWPFPKYLKEKFGTVPDAFHMVLRLGLACISIFAE